MSDCKFCELCGLIWLIFLFSVLSYFVFAKGHFGWWMALMVMASGWTYRYTKGMKDE